MIIGQRRTRWMTSPVSAARPVASCLRGRASGSSSSSDQSSSAGRFFTEEAGRRGAGCAAAAAAAAEAAAAAAAELLDALEVARCTAASVSSGAGGPCGRALKSTGAPISSRKPAHDTMGLSSDFGSLLLG